MLDTGSGTSIIDCGTLQKIGLDNQVDKTRTKSLINASGDEMKILRSVNITVTIPGSQPRNQIFQVLNNVTYSNILLGRDFMKKFGRVKFNFDRNTIQLGKLTISGLTTTNNQVRLHKTKTRSKKTLFVKCSTVNALLESDFEPKIVPNITGVYATRNRIIPNIDGLFPIIVLNFTTSDIQLKSGKLMGSLQPTSETVSCVSAGENTDFDMNDITLDDNLSAIETNQLKSIINNYKDVFATNPRNPKRTDLLEHKIITSDALPVYHKLRRLPVSWEKDVDRT